MNINQHFQNVPQIFLPSSHDYAVQKVVVLFYLCFDRFVSQWKNVDTLLSHGIFSYVK